MSAISAPPTNNTGSNVPAVTRRPQMFSATLNKGQECRSKQGLLMERLPSTFHWRNAFMEDASRNHRSAGTVHMGLQLKTHADQLGHPRFEGEVSDDSRKLFFTKSAFSAGKNCLYLPGNLCSWFKQWAIKTLTQHVPSSPTGRFRFSSL